VLQEDYPKGKINIKLRNDKLSSGPRMSEYLFPQISKGLLKVASRVHLVIQLCCESVNFISVILLQFLQL